MSSQTYVFYGMGGVIPGVIGQFSANTWVTIDTDTLQIVTQGFLPTVVPVVVSDTDTTYIDYGEAGSIPDVPNQAISTGHEEVVDITSNTVLQDTFLTSQ